jgi:hypothetical protein
MTAAPIEPPGFLPKTPFNAGPVLDTWLSAVVKIAVKAGLTGLDAGPPA